jgi:hypothetical protein
LERCGFRCGDDPSPAGRLIASEDFQSRLTDIAGPFLRGLYTFPSWYAPDFRFFFHDKHGVDIIGIPLRVRTKPVEKSEHPNAKV